MDSHDHVSVIVTVNDARGEAQLEDEALQGFLESAHALDVSGGH